MLQPAWCQITCASRAKVERWVEEVEAVVDESADSQRTAPKSFDRIKKKSKTAFKLLSVWCTNGS